MNRSLSALWAQPRVRRLFYVCLFVLALRLSLSLIIKTGANQVLDHMTRYRGHIDHVGLSFWRGAYQFQGVKIVTIDGKVPLPLFEAKNVDIALEWRPLLRGQAVASVVLEEPALNFVNGPAATQSQFGLEQDWLPIIQKLVILKVNRLVIRQGQAHFADPYQAPPLDVHIDAIEVRLSDIRLHRPITAKGLPCSLSLSARVMDQAPLSVSLTVDVFAQEPTFEYSATLQSLDLNRLDLVFQRGLGVNVAKGEFSVYSEGVSDQGEFKGYVKPFVKGLTVIRRDDKVSPKLAKKLLVSVLAWILKDHFHDQTATSIPLSGSLKGRKTEMHANWFAAALGWVGNATFFQQDEKLDQRPDLHKVTPR